MAPASGSARWAGRGRRWPSGATMVSASLRTTAGGSARRIALHGHENFDAQWIWVPRRSG
jgi:hypothetical protein